MFSRASWKSGSGRACRAMSWRCAPGGSRDAGRTRIREAERRLPKSLDALQRLLHIVFAMNRQDDAIPRTPKREALLAVRLTPDHLRRLKLAAVARGQTLAEHVRERLFSPDATL